MNIWYLILIKVFLGTRSFPKENDYEQFIYDNGGSFNAYTSSDHSLYYFDGVNPSSLNAALHRLSCFFHEPLFQDSSSDRERNAVDQEYKMNIEQDGWRKHHVFKQLARKDHPFSMFNTGNLHTMKLIDVEYLKKWHAANYTSDLLNVAILGRESIPELTEMATRLFSNIPRGLIKSINHDNIFPDDLKGKIIRIEPKMDIKEISIVWEIPRCNIETKPASQLGYIIGQETSNSLYIKINIDYQS